jgi:hypothetical protein
MYESVSELSVLLLSRVSQIVRCAQKRRQHQPLLLLDDGLCRLSMMSMSEKDCGSERGREE